MYNLQIVALSVRLSYGLRCFLLTVNWFYFTTCHIDADYKVEDARVEDYPEMDEEVEDIDPGWDDEGNGEGDDDGDYKDEYDDEALPDEGIIRFYND